ncbi:MAG TPA: HEAT repeat domain-containing protein [Verrucomicrobiae bacterium]|nr:HEAT repeat domain-containing protein [Verrucomicrobiae bacterium]
MPRFRKLNLLALVASLPLGLFTVRAAPVLLDARFELPPGFHIYRAADPELTGGSYDLAFDGEGRLLVGDGTAVRRLEDTDSDGVYDRFEVIATGLGRRGPQGLLVWGDRLYAVGGDGLQLFEGYKSGKLVHRGRLGAKFNTGGDHDLHTVLRGHDDWLYLMAGNGAGIEGRRHITETNSPMLEEREASVFRLAPDGKKWECLASGGRNPPSLGLNHVGELFSFDSDMEWHVGLPFYKPVRLNHWAVGTDQGWQEVGAFPSYYIDCVPHVVDAGRGSPNWGAFYEHRQFPRRYHNAFLVCDYRWKRESNDQYATTGRLVAFFLERDGASWKAQMEVAVRPKPGARDAAERPINFALVDVEVAPDGSVFLSDHNQGLWRVFHDGQKSGTPIPAVRPNRPPLPDNSKDRLEELLHLPQPLAEWSRVREEAIRNATGPALSQELQRVALDRARPIQDRVRAVQLLAPGFEVLETDWLQALSRDPEGELRAQAAWLMGFRGESESAALLRLIEDKDDLVRRRAVEGLTRVRTADAIPALIRHLNDSSRLIRYISMNALAHHPASEWLNEAVRAGNAPAVQCRALVACLLRSNPPPSGTTRQVVGNLLEGRKSAALIKADRLDLLRVVALFQNALESEPSSKKGVVDALLEDFPDKDRDIRWEQVRLLGLYRVEQSFPRLLALLLEERDEVTQFHIAQSLARLPGGWLAAEEESAMAWFEGTQRGWFAEFTSKGVEFPQFWATALTEFARHHPEAMLRRAPHIDVASLLGGALLDRLVAADSRGDELVRFYRQRTRPEEKARIARALGRIANPMMASVIREELKRGPEQTVRLALVQSLAAQATIETDLPFLIEGLESSETEAARACIGALMRQKPSVTAVLAQACLDRLVEGSRHFHSVERLLVTLTGRQRAGYRADVDLNRRPDESSRQAAVTFWQGWYETQYGRAFMPKQSGSSREKSDDEVSRFIASAASRGGDARRGARHYETLQCHTCHGGGAAPGREGHIFGPDLAGATRRLSRVELAESLVFPSKQVADRFKAFSLEGKDGTVLTGFITEQTDTAVTFADQQQVRQIPRTEIIRLAPQASSLMPDRLFNRLTEDDMRDLLAYLDTIGVSP